MISPNKEMFVVIADIQLKDEAVQQFMSWFEESNKTLSRFDGFISRRLLESDNGHHRIIVEHKSQETFKQMHQSEEHSRLHAKAVTFMKKPPTPTFYKIVAG